MAGHLILVRAKELILLKLLQGQVLRDKHIAALPITHQEVVIQLLQEVLIALQAVLRHEVVTVAQAILHQEAVIVVRAVQAPQEALTAAHPTIVRAVQVLRVLHVPIPEEVPVLAQVEDLAVQVQVEEEDNLFKDFLAL